MKSFIVLICVFVSAHSLKKALVDELHETMQTYGAECFATEHGSEADLEDLMNKRIPSTREGRCTVFCTLKKIKIMKEDGSYGEGHVEWLAKAKADDPDFYSKLMNLYDVCQNKVQNEDPCEKAAELGQCAKDEGKKVGLSDYLM